MGKASCNYTIFEALRRMGCYVIRLVNYLRNCDVTPTKRVSSFVSSRHRVSVSFFVVAVNQLQKPSCVYLEKRETKRNFSDFGTRSWKERIQPLGIKVTLIGDGTFTVPVYRNTKGFYS